MLLATGVAAAMVLTSGSAWAAPSVSAERYQGEDRYETARAIAEATFPSSNGAILASGESFPDALAAGYRAGATEVPILLTTSEALAAPARTALATLGVEEVLIVGGPAAVSTAVEDELRELGYDVTREAGADRYATARRIAESVPATDIGAVGGVRTAFVATGQGFADALAAGPLAYAEGLPMLLTPKGSLNADTRAALEGLEIDAVVLLGGTGAIEASVAEEIAALGITVRRVSGSTRTETAAEIADLAVDELGFTTTHVNLARGDSFADALAGSAHAGEERGVILLTQGTNTLGDATAAWLRGRSDDVASLHVFGGSAAISDAVVAAAREASGDETASPPPADGPAFDELSAREEIGFVNVFYTEAVRCDSIAADGSDFVLELSGEAVTILEARCGTPGVSDTVVNLAFSDVPMANETVTVRAKVGTDGTTVVGLDGAAQAPGDEVQAQARPL